MQLTKLGKDQIQQLCQSMTQLKQVADEQLVMPTIELFSTSISAEAKIDLKNSLLQQYQSVTGGSYAEVIQNYRKQQVLDLNECITLIVLYINNLGVHNNNPGALFNALITFLTKAQLWAFSIDLPVVEKLNHAVRFRLIYQLIDCIVESLFLFKSNENIIDINESDEPTLLLLQNCIQALQPQKDRRKMLAKLFNNELHIREASIIATGNLPRQDQLQDIFTVYHTIQGDTTHIAMQDNCASYYHMVLNTFSYLSNTSSVIRSPKYSGELSVNVRPISQEVSIRHSPAGGTLVRRSQFGINICYEDNSLATSDLTSADSFNNDYTVKPYRLNPEIKIAYLSHIEKLEEALKNDPKHEHAIRRAQKLTALKRIILADDEGDLTPVTFEKAKDKKAYLYVAYGHSKTKQLFEKAEADIRQKMEQKLVLQTHCIGRYGYALSDSELVQRLVNKLNSFNLECQFDVSMPLNEYFEPHQERLQLSGRDLWNYDKKIALEIILLCHAKQLLHPALFSFIERKFPHMYARSFSFFRASEVQLLMQEAKENILTLCWQDAANAGFYQSQQGRLAYE